jgi:hypothetical protein
MYGMVNKAVEDMVLMHYDEATWEKIKHGAGVDVDVFISNDAYPDEMTYHLVAAAAETLAMPAEQVLEAFGEHWVLVTAQAGYGDLMGAGGRTLAEFLRNLPGFHARVALIFPNLKPPTFQVSHETANSLHLHYYSHRAGLQPFVLGLVHGLAKRFATAVQVSVIADRRLGADHDAFLVEWFDVEGQ